VTVAHADPTPPTSPLAHPTPRQVVEELLRRKVELLTSAAESGHGDLDSVGQFEAEVVAFLDAVDATGAGVPYGDAVVILGESTVVAHARDYYATTAYWHTLAGGAAGTVTAIPGPDVMAALST
jgi:hypothetical protein